jgi:disulfide bond formation protein DsbB
MILQRVQPYFILCAWFVALCATCAALYGSEVMHLSVCNLCWYQRVAMFPLVLILGIASYRKDFLVTWYAMPLAAIGLLFATYQYLEQVFKSVSSIYTCSITTPCNEVTFKLFGFLTFPILSMFAFTAILLCLGLAHRQSHRKSMDE